MQITIHTMRATQIMNLLTVRGFKVEKLRLDTIRIDFTNETRQTVIEIMSAHGAGRFTHLIAA